MRKIPGLICASAMLCFAGSIFPSSADAQTYARTPVVVAPPPVAPSNAATPMAPSTAPSTELVPLSDLSDAPMAKSAKTKQVHHAKRKHAKKARHSGGGDRTRLRSAQISLDQLGYRPGNADGVMGAKTKAALKQFQRDQHLHADGILGPVTYDALMRESGSRNPMQNSAAPPENFFAAHPDYYGYYGANYANPTALGSPQAIPNRFGNMEVDQQQAGQNSQYAVMLNGKVVFHAENQPAPINVSRTFNIGNADAIVLTSYGANNSTCPYHHYVLAVGSSGPGLHEIANCTRDYQAFTEQGSLFISFPGDSHDGWNGGSMWRYENGSLEKL